MKDLEIGQRKRREKLRKMTVKSNN